MIVRDLRQLRWIWIPAGDFPDSTEVLQGLRVGRRTCDRVQVAYWFIPRAAHSLQWWIIHSSFFPICVLCRGVWFALALEYQVAVACRDLDSIGSGFEEPPLTIKAILKHPLLYARSDSF